MNFQSKKGQIEVEMSPSLKVKLFTEQSSLHTKVTSMLRAFEPSVLFIEGFRLNKILVTLKQVRNKDNF